MATTPSPRTPGVDYETKTVRIIIQDRAGRKTFEKMLAQGWEVDHIADGFGRSSHYVFRRPKKFSSAREDPGSLGGAILRGMDKVTEPDDSGTSKVDRWGQKLDAWEKKTRAESERMKDERIAERESKKIAKAAKKAEKKNK